MSISYCYKGFLNKLDLVMAMYIFVYTSLCASLDTNMFKEWGPLVSFNQTSALNIVFKNFINYNNIELDY